MGSVTGSKTIVVYFFLNKNSFTINRHANFNALFEATLFASISIFRIEYTRTIEKTSIIFIAVNASLEKTLEYNKYKTG